VSDTAPRPAFPARVRLGPGTKPANTTVGRTAPAADGQAGGRSRQQAPVFRDRQRLPARAQMVEQLARNGIRDPRVLQAMASVDRHLFVDSALGSRAYEDTALPIGLGQTISKPSVVARMTELLLQGGVTGGDGRLGRVLDIGTGCGYQALVLAQLATEVYSLERLRALHEKARANLRQLRVPNIHLILGDGMAGFGSGAPYAGILAAAGGQQVPRAWVEQLAVGGRIVAPVAAAASRQALTLIDKTADGVRQTVLEDVCFVPLKSGVG